MTHFGVSDGDECNRNGCGGTMVLHPVKDCSCHTDPPCNACVDNQPICNECGANPDDDLVETVSPEQRTDDIEHHASYYDFDRNK